MPAFPGPVRGRQFAEIKLRDPEVSDFHLATFRQQNIRRFEISMNDAVAVRVIESPRKIANKTNCLERLEFANSFE
jgi:hypothetical protein